MQTMPCERARRLSIAVARAAATAASRRFCAPSKSSGLMKSTRSNTVALTGNAPGSPDRGLIRILHRRLRVKGPRQGRVILPLALPSCRLAAKSGAGAQLNLSPLDQFSQGLQVDLGVLVPRGRLPTQGREMLAQFDDAGTRRNAGDRSIAPYAGEVCRHRCMATIIHALYPPLD